MYLHNHCAFYIPHNDIPIPYLRLWISTSVVKHIEAILECIDVKAFRFLFQDLLKSEKTKNKNLNGGQSEKVGRILVNTVYM